MPARMLRDPLARGAILLFLLLAGPYCFSIGLRATRGAAITGDEPFYLLTTQSLIQDGNLDLREQYATLSYESFFDHPSGLWKQSVPLADGTLVSPHEPGLSVLLLPGFGIGGLLGAQVELLFVAALTFALAFVFVALETGRVRTSWLVTAVVALAAPGFVYATEVYPEIPGALCIVAALLVLRRRSTRLFSPISMAFLLSLLAWFGLKFVPLGMLVAAWYLVTASNRQRAWFVGLSVASALAYAWFHLQVYGALTPYNTNTVYEGAATTSVLDSHIAFADRFYRTWGLFLDRRFGLARWAPIFLAILPALPLLPRGTRTGSLVAALISTQVLVATFVAITMMGWWFPGRHLMVVYPLFPLALTVAVIRLPNAGRALAAVLAAYSLLVTATLAWIESKGEIVIAVNPFDMRPWWFRWEGHLFPYYTYWGRETVLLNAAWLVIGGSLLAWICWHQFARGKRIRLPLRSRAIPSRT